MQKIVLLILIFVCGFLQYQISHLRSDIDDIFTMIFEFSNDSGGGEEDEYVEEDDPSYTML